MEIKELGLSEKEAGRRLARNGLNILPVQKGKSVAQTFLEQLNDPLIYVLAVAAGVSLLLREYGDAVIILVVVTFNAFVGTLQEGKAKKALDALRKLQSPKALVVRDGRQREVPAAELAEGDLVCLEAGALVPADVRLIEVQGLKTEESALTGESLPVEKCAGMPGETGTMEKRSAGMLGETGTKEKRSAGMFGEPGTMEKRSAILPGEPVPLGDRRDLAFMSTMVTEGKGKGIVIATGRNTEIGKIAGMISVEKEEATALQKRLGELGTILSLLSLLLCAALFGMAVLQKRDVMQMLITAISLAVAAVPEGLPAAVTICLALSVTRMVKAGTIVRRLPCVEALGAVNVVCSDKTGTLTQNCMKPEMGYWEGAVHRFHLKESEMHAGQRDLPPEDYLRGWVLCNNATKELGDPTERALLELGQSYGIDKEELERQVKRTGEIPFSSESRKMTTWHVWNGERSGYRKGAVDVVLKDCAAKRVGNGDVGLTWKDRQEILTAAAKLAGMGYRVLALAMQGVGNKGGGLAGTGGGNKGGGLTASSSESWSFLGLVALGDPIRPEAAGAVLTLKNAGVDTIMITGDHVKTALAIGKQLGIASREAQTITGDKMAKLSEEDLIREMRHGDVRIFARVSPAQKVRIVKALKRQGKIVAMTGDGVNDAPALKAADIGIAMGKNGTDVAREAADLVLTDDNFATIERAVEEGRSIYENIRKSVIFLLSSNLGELLTMFVAVACGFMAPLKSCHVLWINLITDSLPALALGVDPGDGKALMKHPPRKERESLFARGGMGCTCFYGILIAAISLTAYSLPVLPLLAEAADLKEWAGIIRGGLTSDAFLLRGQTYAFTVLGMSQLFHAIGMRDVNRSVFAMKPLENKVMLLAVGMGVLLQMAVTEIPFLNVQFGTAPLSLAEWGILTLLASLPLVAHEIIALFMGEREEKSGR